MITLLTMLRSCIFNRLISTAMVCTVFLQMMKSTISIKPMIRTTVISNLYQRDLSVPLLSSFTLSSCGTDIEDIHEATGTLSNKEKGDMYEIQIRNHILFLGKPAYLWSDTPVQILIDNGILASHNDHRLKRIANNEARLNPLSDTGVDIIQMEPDGSCTFVQCKNGYRNGVTIEDLAGFFLWLFHYPRLNGHVYYTDRVSQNLKDMPPDPRLSYIKHPFINTASTILAANSIMLPYQYQLDVVKCFKEKLGNRAILSMPCGTGKTFVSYLLSKNHRQIIILSPLKQNTKQSLDKFIEYGYSKENTLLVDSDGERDIDNIKKFIKENDSFLISATFCSTDVIREALSFMDDPFIIVDEFHNLSKRNVMDINDDFYSVLNSEHDILFMSATPRVYEMEGDIDGIESIVDDDYNQRVFGPTIDSMSFREAIEKKYISDYKIWLPSISSHDDLLDEQLDSELSNELSINDINPKVKDKCNFLLLSLSNTGSMKCIIYCVDTKEIAEFTEALNTLNKFHQFEYDISQITCSDSEMSRKEILSQFSTSEKRQLLFSVRILDEGIDIPSCDSIFITYPSKSKIRTIQRLNRCTRIDKANPFKIGNIFLWCDEYEEILGTLCELKEYDPFFKDKISVSNIDYYGNTDKKQLQKDDEEVLSDLVYKVGMKAYVPKEWRERFNDLRKFVIENKILPSSESSDPYVKSLGKWRKDQQWNYKYEIRNMKIGAVLRDTWSDFMAEFPELHLSGDEKWEKRLLELRKYVIANKKLPSSKSSDPYVKSLGEWRNTQQHNCNNEKYNMIVGAAIRDAWSDLVDEFPKLFLSGDEKWKYTLAEAEKYIIANNELPSLSNDDPDIKFLGRWLNTQQQNYKNEKQIMKNIPIRDIWISFIKKYEKHFISADEKWKYTLAEVEKYIIANYKLPTPYDDDPDIKSLGTWLDNQRRKSKNEKGIMKNVMIRDIWINFTKKYEKHFISADEKWKSTLAEVEKYIIANHILPSRSDNDPDIKFLGRWLSQQQQNYKNDKQIMKNVMIRDIWKKFTKKYKKLFMSADEKWKSTLAEVEEYIIANDELPSRSDNDPDIKFLGRWLNAQQRNYKNEKQIMKNIMIRDIWINFKNKHEKYFSSNDKKLKLESPSDTSELLSSQ